MNFRQRWLLAGLLLAFIFMAVDHVGAAAIESIAPGYSAWAIKIVPSGKLAEWAVERFNTEPALKEWRTLAASCKVDVRQIKTLLFVQDDRGKRGVLLCMLDSAASVDNLFNVGSPNLKPESPGVYSIVNIRELHDVWVTRLAPDVIGFYQAPKNGRPFAIDKRGMPEILRDNLELTGSGFAVATGEFVWSGELGRIIREYRIEASHISKNSRDAKIQAQFLTKDSWNTVALHSLIIGSCSALLQQYCDRTPEQANEDLKMLKFKVSGNTLTLTIDSVEQFAQLYNNVKLEEIVDEL